MSKIMPLSTAIETYIEPGDIVLAAYTNARPNAALMQLARSFAGKDADLTLVTAGMVSVQHALVELGVVTKVVASFVGENYPMARPNRAFQRAVAEGRVEIENWSMWALIARLVAGGLGIGHFPVKSIAGSSMEKALEASFTMMPDPFTGKSVGVVAALNPDITVVHAVAADEDGNLVLSAPYGEAQWGALAARRGVVATVERIVPREDIIANNTLVKVPGHLVRSVSLAPFGSHPYGLLAPSGTGVRDYIDDGKFMATVLAASRSAETFAEWIDEWVLGTPSHEAYLAKVGDEHLEMLVESARPGQWEQGLGEPWDGPPTPIERQILAAARQIDERVESQGFDAILSGVGQANLASWVAADAIKGSGRDVELMAEIGMYGYSPRPGEPFIFSHRNLPTSTVLTDVMTVLGAYVSGPSTRTLGVLGAGQVDQAGNTNSTITADGSFLVGSGGANDIASGADEILLTVAHERLVESVPYVTSPGRQVQSVVSSLGVFERVAENWQLMRYIADEPRSLEEAVVAMRTASPWKFDVSPTATREPDPTPAQLALLRGFDPEKVFLRDPLIPAVTGVNLAN